MRSDRYIYANATCEQARIISMEGNTYTYEYNGENKSVTLYVSRNTTTYMSMRTNDVGDVLRCGEDIGQPQPRCAIILVLQRIEEAEGDSYLYSCESHILDVENAILPEHYLPDKIALTAASSLTHSGITDLDGMNYAYYADK